MSTRSPCGTSQVRPSYINLISLTDDHAQPLYRRLAKRPRDRHSSSNSHPNSTSANRKSRSHSPGYQKPQKRRNTMNSRDAAAYDEMMALIVERSAVEAAAAVAAQSSPSPINGSVNGLGDFDERAASPATAKKKRKRGSEDAFVSFSLVVSVPLTQLPSIAPRLNVLDPRRRPRTVPLPPSPHRRTHQRQRLNLFQCPRRHYRPRKAARRAIDVGVVVVADPPPRLKMQCRWMGRRVS